MIGVPIVPSIIYLSEKLNARYRDQERRIKHRHPSNLRRKRRQKVSFAFDTSPRVGD